MRRGQGEALTALASGCTHDQAAAAANVNPSTIRRWLRFDSEFGDELRLIRSEKMASAVRILTAAATDAATQLVQLAVEPHSNAPVRMAALRLLLSTAQADDLEQRIEALEHAVAAEPLRVVQ